MDVSPWWFHRYHIMVFFFGGGLWWWGAKTCGLEDRQVNMSQNPISSNSTDCPHWSGDTLWFSKLVSRHLIFPPSAVKLFDWISAKLQIWIIGMRSRKLSLIYCCSHIWNVKAVPDCRLLFLYHQIPALSLCLYLGQIHLGSESECSFINNIHFRKSDPWPCPPAGPQWYYISRLLDLGLTCFAESNCTDWLRWACLCSVTDSLFISLSLRGGRFSCWRFKGNVTF